MSERIIEIAEEAANQSGFTGYNAWFNEKFAKLIVQECMGLYISMDRGNRHYMTDDYLKALHKHFGIEK